MLKKKSTPRPLYSQRFLEKYGRGLKREETRLVQGFRGLSADLRSYLLAFSSALVTDRDVDVAVRRVARDQGRGEPATSYATAAPEHHWRCDEPNVTKQAVTR
jgi:hypothetical protein